ncbi:unnamed protein product [Plutella xylostella]|uniref:(diamondback moth) hypothetical protein n=1 Tax=Plutella xylostella TaxID=51655 RepID=A0A8S4G600_PLUXY|nr:unnamed protein product [Plutella xylostella]
MSSKTKDVEGASRRGSIPDSPAPGSNGSNGSSGEVDLDRILVEELGQFGRYQLRTFLLCILLVIFVAFSASEYVFTTSRIRTRCAIPECDTADTPFAPSWILSAVNGTSQSSFDGCARFPRNTSAPLPDQSCPPELFDQTTTVACEERVYENTHTVVYDYDLGCEEWRRSLIGTIRTFGTLTALPITGYLSDTFGRRVTLALNAFNTCWLGVVRYWADTYWGFTISEFVESTFGSGGFSCAYILLMEVVGPKYRVAAGAAMNTCFSTGQVIMGLIAWAVPNWRTFTLVLYLPMVVTISYFWLMSESVRWLMSKGRFEESEEVLKTVARVNRTTLSEKSLQQLRASALAQQKRSEIEAQERSKEPWLPVIVFRNKPILLRCIVSPIWWLTCMFVYYGLSINAVNLSGNRYLNYIAVSSVEIPGYWTAFVLMGKIGRKPVLIFAFWACAACQIGYIFLQGADSGISLALYLIGKFCIAMVLTSVYVYTAELYPTKYRHSLFAFSSMIGRVGSMTAPLTPALGATFFEELPFALFAGFCVLSGALMFFTPETMGCRLPNTLQEAIDLGKKKEDTAVAS